MKVNNWYWMRGSRYILKRAAALLRRYGLGASKGKRRVERLIRVLAEYGCAPTLPTPGSVVRRHPAWFRHLQALGAEIAVHSFDHVDLSAYPTSRATRQLLLAAETFVQCGIAAYGFRCPYLRCTASILEALEDGLFQYSSNRAISWDRQRNGQAGPAENVSAVLRSLYSPVSAADAVCVPSSRNGLIEIPVCLPDDLELHDGMGLSALELASAWLKVLQMTHERGELFALLFHPELARLCQASLVKVLKKASSLYPPVWIARLRDISEWWSEKAEATATLRDDPAGYRISFDCTDRATILARGLVDVSYLETWNERYHRLRRRELVVPGGLVPFLGLTGSAPEKTVSFLRDQGYIVDTSDAASQCATYIDPNVLQRASGELELIQLIESSSTPLVRYWRWPNGAKSALSLSGDLDALSILDYASRLIAH